jgi:hypothetical protein
MRADLELIATWDGFRGRLRNPSRRDVACRLGGELAPAACPPVDPLQLLAEARAHPEARILRQPPGDALDLSADCAAELRAMPLEQAAREPLLHLSLFDLAELCGPGRALHALSEAVFRPFAALWRENGVRWEGEFWPILFLGGSRSATNYHIDPTPNVTLHLFGRKRFHSLKEPDRWCPPAVKDAYTQARRLAVRPPGLGAEEVLVHDLSAPGDLVWIPCLTPHWVDAGSFSGTLTFAFRGFRMCDEHAR